MRKSPILTEMAFFGVDFLEVDRYGSYRNSPPKLDHRRFIGIVSSDYEVLDILNPWKRHTTTLREVRFVRNWVWRRAYAEDAWCKRAIEDPGHQLSDI